MGLGDGSRFAAGAAHIMKSEGLSKARAGAIMASAGRAKYGAKKMGSWASAGRKRANRGAVGE